LYVSQLEKFNTYMRKDKKDRSRSERMARPPTGEGTEPQQDTRAIIDAMSKDEVLEKFESMLVSSRLFINIGSSSVSNCWLKN
jgi:hypothetical protein